MSTTSIHWIQWTSNPPAVGYRKRFTRFAIAKASSIRRIAFLLGTIGFLCCNSLRGQIAPGPLSPAHSFLSGITKCVSCHDLLSSGMKCLNCHDEIKRRVEAGTGYHARAYNRSAGTADCVRCHAEHRRPGTALVPLDRKTFDHGSQTGFVLEGRHRSQQCEHCHSAARIDTAVRTEIKVRDLNRSFLGLRRECTACHREPHGNQLGSDCLSCHTPDAWKPASKFNHSRAQFQLTGMHQRVSCEKCHSQTNILAPGTNQNVSAQGASPQRIFKGLPFSGCNSCHVDRHQGAFQRLGFGTRCERCHDTGGFRGKDLGKAFNHGATGFQLSGKHAELSCAKCHKEGNFKRAIAHERCGDCHPDPHNGQFASRAGSPDCSACHSPTDFKPALFKREMHALNIFPLEGKHSTLQCVKCHKPENRELLFRAGKRICSECHSEPHGGEFASQPYNNKCDSCHSEAGFETTTFSRERHAQTRFPLNGRHSEIACAQCHKPLPVRYEMEPLADGGILPASLPASGKSTISKPRLQFRFASRTCDVCHLDPHEIRPEVNLSCNNCHIPQQWGVLLPFDHSSVSQKLEGVHREAANQFKCAQCHKMREIMNENSVRTAPAFSKAAIECVKCHADKDPHGGQFGILGNGQKDCSSCHTSNAWNSGSFDHNKTQFALTIQHQNVSCTKCHNNQKEVNGKTVRWYRDTQSDCLNCH